MMFPFRNSSLTNACSRTQRSWTADAQR